MKAPKTAVSLVLIILFGLSITVFLCYQTLSVLSLVPTQNQSRFQISSFKPPMPRTEVLAASASATATPSTPLKTIKPTPKPTTKATSTSSPAPVSSNPSEITPMNLLTALNNYRLQKGKPSLVLNHKLHSYAQSRSDLYLSQGKMDSHQGFNQFIDNDGFSQLGFQSLAENSSSGFNGTPQGLIEQLYGQSTGHNNNQLSTEYTHVGIGVSGQFTNIVFGGSPR